MSTKNRKHVSEINPPLPPEDEPTAAADHSAPNTEGPATEETIPEETTPEEVTPAADPAGERQAEGEEPAVESGAAEADQAETESAPESESQGSEPAAGPDPEAEADTEESEEPAEAEAENGGDQVLPLSEYVRDVYGDEHGDTEESTPSAGQVRERWFEILFDTVGSGPSFHKGEQVAESDLEFLGIERLIEIRAIREL